MALHWPYSPDEAVKIGELFPVSEAQEYSEKFKTVVGSSGKEDPLASKFIVDGVTRNAEFIGLNGIEELIARAKKVAKVVGIRIYYGLAYESLNTDTGISEISPTPIKGGDPVERPRLFLVAVDEKGADIKIDLTGFKDVPDGNGVGGGSPQPPYGQS